jgi:hypothetical protein
MEIGGLKKPTTRRYQPPRAPFADEVAMASPPGSRAPPVISDAEVHYGAGTKPQGPLPFSSWIRRRFWWWPGSERHGGLTDRLILAALIAPGAAWALLSLGWIPAVFVIAETVVIAEIVYRVASGTMLGD